MIEITRILLLDSSQETNVHNYMPLGLGYLASYLSKKLPNHEFVFKATSKDYKNEILTFKPDIVGVSSLTCNYAVAKEICKLSKETFPDVPVIIGGMHVSCYPFDITPFTDVTCIGEGEETFLELVKQFIRDGNLKDTEKLKKINGISFKDQDRVIATPPRELIENLDEIPFPDRELLNVQKNKEYLYIFSSRGCPYRCSFCSSSHFWKRIRFFSAEYVIKELDYIIHTYAPKRIEFLDDLFIANVNRLRKIVEAVESNGWNKIVEFSCLARANLVTDEVASLLKRMNVWRVSLGLESGCPKILKYLKGTSVTVEDNMNSVKILKRHGLGPINGYFIIGSPDETEEDLKETYEFMKKIPLDEMGTFILAPLPNTPVWDYAKKRGIVSDNMDWQKIAEGFDGTSSIFLGEKVSLELVKKYKEKMDKLNKSKKILYKIKYVLKNPVSAITKGIRRYLKKE